MGEKVAQIYPRVRISANPSLVRW